MKLRIKDGQIVMVHSRNMRRSGDFLWTEKRTLWLKNDVLYLLVALGDNSRSWRLRWNFIGAPGFESVVWNSDTNNRPGHQLLPWATYTHEGKLTHQKFGDAFVGFTKSYLSEGEQ